MMRHTPRALLAGGLGFAVAALVAACGGGSGLLSHGQADSLSSQVDKVAAELSSGNCSAATSAARSFNDAVTNLPSSVNQSLANNIRQGAATVDRLAQRHCQGHTATSTVPAIKTTTTKTTTSTPTDTSTGTGTTAKTTTGPGTSTGTGTSTGPATTSTGSGTTTGPGSGGAGLGGAGGTGTSGNGGSSSGGAGTGH